MEENKRTCLYDKHVALGALISPFGGFDMPILHPNAVLPVKVNGQNVPQSKLPSLLSFLAVFVLMTLVSATIMISVGIDNTNAITIALSCVSNVGPTLGTEIGPVMSWNVLPDVVKWISSLLMLMGRLEIMTVLLLFTPAFWKDN